MNGPAAPTDAGAPRPRSVLEEEREFFLRSLRDLEAEHAAGDIDEADYRSLRDDYTVRAAEVLRRLEAAASPTQAPVAAPGPAPAAPDGGASPSRRRPRRRVLTVVGAVVLVGSIAWTVAAAAGARLPGEESSGQASASAKVEFLLEQALAASGVDDASTAVKDYQAALAVQPDNVEALTGEGAVLIQAGRAADKPALRSLGEAQLRRAETVDPAYGPAYGDLGEALYAEGDYAAAIPQLRGYLEHTPVAARAASVGQELALAVARAGVSS